jgi:adenylate kinase family enzyme
MKIVIGLVGSGKTTLYRKLNENKELNAVEIELPQSCLKNDELINAIFKLFYNSQDIECIIAHPYYLPKDLFKLISPADEIILLEVPLKERLKRIKKRSKELKVKSNIFPMEFILNEEGFLTELKRRIKSEYI